MFLNKIAALSDLGAVLGHLGMVLGRSWAFLAALRVVLLGTSWGDLGGSGLGTCSFLKVCATQDGSGHPPSMVLAVVDGKRLLAA